MKLLQKERGLPILPSHRGSTVLLLLVSWLSFSPGVPVSGLEPVLDLPHAREQWAFRAPQDPPLPKVRATAWPRTGLDHFILSKLESNALTPAPRADKATLIRRVTFDLTGLPPTPDQVDAFLTDSSTNAFEKVVERLLASPQYGEHWGRHWLDQVRYADSVDKRQIGQPGDINESWRYRDWVVNAFNRDLPYDQFILQQFAGDLIPGNGPDGFNADGIVATSMLTIGRWEQGEADKEKMITDIVDDQIDVTGRTFLGLTLACARCHDHKFDPISGRDYYALAGVFYSSHVIPEVGSKAGDTQRLRIPIDPPSELARRRDRERRMTELERQIDQAIDEIVVLRARELLKSSDRLLIASAGYRQALKSIPGLPPSEFLRGRSELASLDVGMFDAWTDALGLSELNLLSRKSENYMGQSGLLAWLTPAAADTPWAVINTAAQERSFSGIRFPAHSVAMHPAADGGVAVSWRSPINGVVRLTGQVADIHDSCGDGVAWEISKRSGAQSLAISTGEMANGGGKAIADGKNADRLGSVAIRLGERIEFAVLPKGSHSCDSTLVELVVEEVGGEGRSWKLAHDLAEGAGAAEAANPQRDSMGHPAVWSFHQMTGREFLAAFPGDSVLKAWFVAAAAEGITPGVEKQAIEIREALLRGDGERSRRRHAALVELGRSVETATDAQLTAAAKQAFEDPSPLTGSSATDGVYRALMDPKSVLWARYRGDESAVPPALIARLGGLRGELETLRRNPPPPPAFAHGVMEGGVPQTGYAGIQDTRVQIRGRYDRPGEVVARRVPELFDPKGQSSLTNGSGRLALARWIASPENPMTARVMVNRLWQFHFGEGIVRTPSNYGKLGQPPTHPELLDYLAHRFVEGGWSIKALHRLILLSATYQQSSTGTPDTQRLDPDNLYFGRMNRRRLTAESLRDSLLAVNGSLETKLGGPPMKELNETRRTLYMMTVRSDGSGYRGLFDAADPTAIVEKRNSTTVAPQALFLMNNPFVLVQATRLARFAASQGPREDAARVEWLYHRLFGRPAGEREVAAGLAAVKAPGVEPAEAWDRYCQVLLCTNEFLYVD